MEKPVKKVHDMIALVKSLLTEQPTLRDNDKELIVAVWARQINQVSTAFDFFNQFIAGDSVSLPETITRARRKVQRACPELRGATWETRQIWANDTRMHINAVNGPTL